MKIYQVIVWNNEDDSFITFQDPDIESVREQAFNCYKENINTLVEDGHYVDCREIPNAAAFLPEIPGCEGFYYHECIQCSGFHIEFVMNVFEI